MRAKSHRKSCSDFMLLTVAFGQLKKPSPEILPLSFNMSSQNCYMPRRDNEGMVNLLGLGEGYRFEFKYLAETLGNRQGNGNGYPVIKTHLRVSAPNY